METGRSTDILFLCILDAKRSTLATGAVPSGNLLSRLHDVLDPKPKREIDRVAVNSSTETEAKRARHSSLASVVANIKQMALGQWKFEEHETLVKLSVYDNEHVLLKFRVTIHEQVETLLKREQAMQFKIT